MNIIRLIMVQIAIKIVRVAQNEGGAQGAFPIKVGLILCLT